MVRDGNGTYVGRAPDATARALALPYLVCLAASAYVVLSVQDQLNPDGVAYLSIARQIGLGEWQAAINGIWSPLYPLLLTPLLMLGVDGVVACKVVGSISCIAIVAGSNALCQEVGVSTRTTVAASACTGVSASFINATVDAPDVLSAALWLPFVLLLMRLFEQPEKMATAVGAGVMWGIAYLSKAYMLWAMLALVCSVAALAFATRPLRNAHRMVRPVLVCTAVAFSVAGSWGLVLGWKYGSGFTFGTAARYNFAFNGPSGGYHRMHTDGLLPPPTTTGVSAADDLSSLNIPSWAPLGSRQNMIYLLTKIWRNLRETFDLLQWYTPFASAALVAIFLFAAADGTRRASSLAILSGSAMIFPAGYLIMHLEHRYLLAPGLICIISTFIAFDLLVHRLNLSASARVAPMVGLFALVCVTMRAPLPGLRTAPPVGRDVRLAAREISSVVPPRSRIASNGEWWNSLSLAHYCSAQYYGEFSPTEPESHALADIEKYSVDTLFIFRNKRPFSVPPTFAAVGASERIDLTVYRRRSAPTSTSAGADDIGVRN